MQLEITDADRYIAVSTVMKLGEMRCTVRTLYRSTFLFRVWIESQKETEGQNHRLLKVISAKMLEFGQKETYLCTQRGIEIEFELDGDERLTVSPIEPRC